MQYKVDLSVACLMPDLLIVGRFDRFHVCDMAAVSFIDEL